MKISIASGKGGTGKTTVAVGLAQASSDPVLLLDCDVEEPNCHLFLNPRNIAVTPLSVLSPKINAAKCTGCGDCSDVCEFNAIIMLGSKPLVFPELCHGCGACVDACSMKAIDETYREIGIVEKGHCGKITLVQGTLNVGEAIASPLIRAVRTHGSGRDLTIIDSPPGATCPTVAAVKDTDYVVLVAEPTPFGYNDLLLAIDMIEALKLRFGVVINRAEIGDDRVKRYCAFKGIPVLAEIKFDRRIAEAASSARAPVDALPEYKYLFESLLGEVQGAVAS
jgi:MinD superfamily P-loop ATPase